MNTPKLTRREFLKIAAATSAVAIPAVAGYGLVRSSEGDIPEATNPYLGSPEEIVQLDEQNHHSILVVLNLNSQNPFGLYLGEMLNVEGLKSFALADIQDVDEQALTQCDLVLLAEGALTQPQVDLLVEYVRSGGSLVAMRPVPELAEILGIARQDSSLASGYMQVSPTHPMTAGIEHRSMQFHGEADVYQLNGAEALAWMAPESTVDESTPAVTLNQFGAGWAGMWAFDLARSVVLMRQGNPDLANIENTDWDGIRAINMFVDWIDLDRIDIPQADEQQRLLSNMITLMLAARVPLPRLGYFPFGAESLFIVTGDSHGNPGWAIEEALSFVEEYNGHMSVYYTSFPNSTLRRAVKRASLFAKDLPVIGDLLDERVHAPTPNEIADWRARGHEFALHPYVEEGVQVGWETYWQEFTAMGYGPVSPTTRTHRIQWQGWVETAKIQAGYGIGLNLDYYVWGPIFQKPTGEWVLGHFTGSSYPMRFIDETGKIIHSYQVLTQIADDHLLNLSWGGIARLSPEEAAKQSIQLIADSVEKYHAMHVAQFHVDPYVLDAESSAKERRFMQLILDYVSSRNILIWSALDLLRFTEARDATHLENLVWDANKCQLSFSMTSSAAEAMQLTVLVPSQYAGLSVTQITLDGSPVAFQDIELAGVSYSSFPASSQDHLVIVSYS